MWRVQMDDDQAAYVQLVDRWQKPILGLCARMTGDSHLGEDLKQETFARVFTKRKEYRPEAKFSTWLWRIALNLCYDELRKRHRRPEQSLEENDNENDWLSGFASEDLSPDVSLVAREEGEIVSQALQRLPEPLRTVLVLRYCEGLKLREVAEILDIPQTTASSRIAVALSAMTRVLEPQLMRASEAMTAKERRI